MGLSEQISTHCDLKQAELQISTRRPRVSLTINLFVLSTVMVILKLNLNANAASKVANKRMFLDIWHIRWKSLPVKYVR